MLDRQINSISRARLRKHADYQRVYRESRKHSSASMTYFFAERRSLPDQATAPDARVGPRVGLTAGRVLGKAVDRNRIKRRMREAVRLNLNSLTRDVDVVLHPRRSVLAADARSLLAEILRIFTNIEQSLGRRSLVENGAGK